LGVKRNGMNELVAFLALIVHTSLKALGGIFCHIKA
jgi:hypothetical protein